MARRTPGRAGGRSKPRRREALGARGRSGDMAGWRWPRVWRSGAMRQWVARHWPPVTRQSASLGYGSRGGALALSWGAAARGFSGGDGSLDGEGRSWGAEPPRTRVQRGAGSGAGRRQGRPWGDDGLVVQRVALWSRGKEKTNDEALGSEDQQQRRGCEAREDSSDKRRRKGRHTKKQQRQQLSREPAGWLETGRGRRSSSGARMRWRH